MCLGASQGNQTGQLCSVQWCYGNFSTDSALVAAKRGKCAAGSSQGGLRVSLSFYIGVKIVEDMICIFLQCSLLNTTDLPIDSP